MDRFNKKSNNQQIIAVVVLQSKIANHQEHHHQFNKNLLHIIAMDKIMDTNIIITTINNNK